MPDPTVEKIPPPDGENTLIHASSHEIFTVEPPGEVAKTMDTAFYRGEHTNFNPYQKDHRSSRFLERFVLNGLTPSERFIKPETRVTTFGSCFAINIGQHLSGLGFDVAKDRQPDIYISRMGEGLVTVPAILQQIEWAFGYRKPPAVMWHGYKTEEFGIDEEVRLKTRRVLEQTEVFVLTFGLSEVWYDEVTGGIFWRAVPMRLYDPSRHKFRVLSFAETKQGLHDIYAILQKEVPAARIVMTLSPVPLAATFRPQSCIVSNAASKAILRSALDEFLREHPDAGEDLFYFPAFELITNLFGVPFGEDGRHPHQFIVDAIMQTFEAYFCDTPLTRQEAEIALRKARDLSAQMTPF